MMPTMKMRTSPATKLRSLKSAGCRKGCSAVREGALDEDLGRAEPILELAAIEHHLQRADAEAQHGEAEEVEGSVGIARGVRQERHDAEKGEDADRQVDVEDPAPIV